MQQAIREWAWNVGAEYPNEAWLLSDLDTWERNPFYRGPAQPHPEDYAAMLDYSDEPAECHATPEESAIIDAALSEKPAAWDDSDDIPF